MLEPGIAALHDGAVDHLGVFVEPSLVLGRIKPAPFLSSRTAWENYMNFFLNQNRRHGLISSLIVIGTPATLAIRVVDLPDDTA
jgi:hypothetical protein